jgi:hypothetical protein
MTAEHILQDCPQNCRKNMAHIYQSEEKKLNGVPEKKKLARLLKDSYSLYDFKTSLYEVH